MSPRRDCGLPVVPNNSPHIERRHFLRQVAAAGLVAGAPALPAMAQTGQGYSTAGRDQVSLGETLARYAAELRYEDLPEDVIRIARRSILDTVGCAFGGYAAGPSKIAIKLASDVSSKQAATVLFSGIRTSPDLAVFANGVMIRYLDFNDAFVSLTHGAGHPSDTIAALLTSAE
ncbi:MAG: prpD, partial [Bradyrhizobium sp.]|nr:prpD [Bradyrhizobium sp.]